MSSIGHISRYYPAKSQWITEDDAMTTKPTADADKNLLFNAADPFVRVANVIDALPPSHKLGDDVPLLDALPGIWPTVGDVRLLRDELARRGWTNDYVRTDRR